MKTTLLKASEIPAKARWYLIDAEGQTVGKIATAAARHLVGKHRADFTPHLDAGDGVIVINAAKVRLTGTKLVSKVHHTHSGYRGNLKTETAFETLTRNPTKLVELAVAGMLPKTRAKDDRLLRLKVYVGAEHPHAAQQPTVLTLS